jgi:hypothetical protein
MRLNYIFKEMRSGITIVPVTDDSYVDFEDDKAELFDISFQAYDLARDNRINISRNKELAYVALDIENSQVVGAVWVGIGEDEEQQASIYDFDIVTNLAYRHETGIFFRLMNASMEGFNDLLSYNPRSYIRVWVVNPKLVGILERRYGFEIESHYKDGSAHLIRYARWDK